MEKQELLLDHDRGSSIDDEILSEEQWDSSSSSDKRIVTKTKPLWQMLLLAVLIFSLGCVIGGLASKCFIQPGYKDWTLTYSPGSAHISFKPESSQKPTDPTKDPHFLYSNSVTHEQERVWIDLLQPVTMGLTRHEMELSGEMLDIPTKVRFPDRERYMAVMGVYHKLHCLRTVRRLVYKEVWFSNATEEEWETQKAHADHCLLAVHRAIMCHADTGVNSFHWKKGARKPVLESNSDRMCVDWERFNSWANKAGTGLNPKLSRPKGQ